MTPISRAYLATAWSIKPADTRDWSASAARVIRPAPGLTISMIPRCLRDASAALIVPPCPALPRSTDLLSFPRNPEKSRENRGSVPVAADRGS